MHDLNPPGPGTAGPVDREPSVTPASLRRKAAVSVAGTILVGGLLVYVLAGRGAQFSAALRTAPLPLVGLSVLLQIIGLVTRAEAWSICLRAAGATVSRRVLFVSAAFGCVASIVNGSLGMAARIASIRRAAPQDTPRPAALVAAEVPIIAVELALVAIFSFTLVAPLGVPVWVPAAIIVTMGALTVGLRKVSDRYRTGPGAGLAILRTRRSRRLISFALIAVCAQVLRNWLMLRAVGVDVSIFDSMALLIVMFTVGQLPIGPSTGPAATVLILGAHGIAAAAAAGVLVTVTGIIGSLIFASWATVDRIVARRRRATTSAPARTPAHPAPVLVQPLVSPDA